MINLVKQICIYFLFLSCILQSCKKEELPTLSTTPITNITSASASSGGYIKSDGGAEVTVRGVCWATSPNPTIKNEISINGIGTGSFVSNIKCLSGETTYYVRAYATNNVGTAYGDQQSFTTEISPIVFNSNLTYGSVSDIDGNCYKTIKIGDQTWMAEDLRTSKYNDGTPIQNVTDNTEWASLGDPWLNPQGTSGAFCWYNNDSADYDNDYGKLYNFGAVATGKLCPSGWHVPIIEEWRILREPYTNYPDDVLSGFELMESGAKHWIAPLGTNETGFAALPGGYRSASPFSPGVFGGIGQEGLYWASSPMWGYGGAWFHPIPFRSGYAHTPGLANHMVTDGLSVRCVKDN
jgi:uncharacterized protein (TIGR02145 family)